MPPTPRPDGWKGGSEDFTFVRTLDGHTATERYSVDGNLEDQRNERSFDEADLNGQYDVT